MLHVQLAHRMLCLIVPQVLEAAVIAIPDERWGERPLLIVVPQPHAGGRRAQQQALSVLKAPFLGRPSVCRPCHRLGLG